MKIKKNDAVIEKATGQLMKVILLGGEDEAAVTCEWFDRGSGAYHARTIPLRELTKGNPTPGPSRP